MQQKIENDDGTPIVTDESQVISAWVVVGCMVLGVILLVGVWIFKN